MNQINPFFLIGTVGMLITSILHIFMAVITSEEAASNSFWVLYPVFAGFLIAGTIVMMKRKSPLKE
ncbi:hypothetical protein HC174_02515 [Salinimicrobium sp. CDJ15-81-2]|nr:hypothetical protein [Salinimicrobium nanhaiense]